MRRHKRGSITIETAIAFTITIVFLASVLTAASLLRTDILMQRAVRRTCEDFSIFTPLSITATDTVSTLVNALPDEVLEDQENVSNITNISTYIAGADVATDGALTSAVLDVALSTKFQNDIATEYVEYNGGSEMFLPEYIDVDFSIDMSRQILVVYVTYRVDTMVGPVYMNICDGIPFYGDLELFLNGEEQEESEDEEDDIWGMNNFERGQRFIEMNGGSLPKTFPVINAFDNGTAISVSSIDLTSDYYSDSRRLERRIESDIDELASFDGADVNIDGQNYSISGDEIYQRRYILVIPENSPEDRAELVRNMSEYASERGVELCVEEYGESHSYI